jgi:glucosamine kinase
VGELKRYVIGIDGGGTKTRALIVGVDGAVLAECEGGPTQLQTVGSRQAAVTLFDLIKECSTKIEADAQSLQSIVIGVAGGGRISDRAELSDAILALGSKKKFPLKNITVETDARIALEAAFAGGPGIVVIAGTGSIVLYRTEDGKMLRAGGWGTVLGDEGSGFAIGRDSLTAVLKAYDGRGEKTVLTAKALAYFGIAGIEEIITKVYREHTDVAAFVPKVFEAANERDRIANQILTQNATALADHVRVLTMQVRPRTILPVALMGGVLESENVYSKLVREKINRSLPHVAIQRPKFPSAFGAAIIGLNAFR